MKFVDTHTHIYWDNFENDIDEVVKRAIDNGITKMYCPNLDLLTVEALHNLNKKYPENCFMLMGLHPESVKDDFENQLVEIDRLLQTGKYYGIGEVGIDLYWDKTFLEQQIEAFTEQVRFAKKYKLPVIIHAREAFDEVFNVIDKEIDSSLKGIFHCFTGNIEQANHIIEYKNFKMGIGGVVTYKNSGLAQTIENVDLKHIVLETDAPFLTPVPKRGKRNEPSYLMYIAKFLADLKKVDLSEIAEQTTKNAEFVFGG